MVVPDGAAVVRDDLELTDAALRRYGPKLYVLGDLTLTEASRAALGGLEYLHVAGDVTLPTALVEDFTALDAAKKITPPPRGLCMYRTGGGGFCLFVCDFWYAALRSCFVLGLGRRAESCKNQLDNRADSLL